MRRKLCPRLFSKISNVNHVCCGMEHETTAKEVQFIVPRNLPVYVIRRIIVLLFMQFTTLTGDNGPNSSGNYMSSMRGVIIQRPLANSAGVQVSTAYSEMMETGIRTQQGDDRCWRLGLILIRHLFKLLLLPLFSATFSYHYYS